MNNIKSTETFEHFNENINIEENKDINQNDNIIFESTIL